MVLNKFCEKSSNKKKLTLVSITGGPCSPVKEGHTALILDPQQTALTRFLFRLTRLFFYCGPFVSKWQSLRCFYISIREIRHSIRLGRFASF